MRILDIQTSLARIAHCLWVALLVSRRQPGGAEEEEEEEATMLRAFLTTHGEDRTTAEKHGNDVFRKGFTVALVAEKMAHAESDVSS